MAVMAGSARSRSARASAERRRRASRRRGPGCRGRLPARLAGLGLSATLLAGGCDPFAGPDEDVEVVIGAAHFDFGEDIRFEIRNRTTRDITYWTCADGSVSIGLLRRIRGRWRGAGGWGCDVTGLETLEPGAKIASRRPGVFEEGLYGLTLEYLTAPPFDDFCCVEQVMDQSASEPFHITP